MCLGYRGHPRFRPSFSGAMVTAGPAESACEHRLQICNTDMISPGGNTVAGLKLQENMDELRVLGCTNQDQVTQAVSAMNIPENLKIGTKVFLAGSPANHDPDGNRSGKQYECNGNGISKRLLAKAKAKGRVHSATP